MASTSPQEAWGTPCWLHRELLTGFRLASRRFLLWFSYVLALTLYTFQKWKRVARVKAFYIQPVLLRSDVKHVTQQPSEAEEVHWQ